MRVSTVTGAKTALALLLQTAPIVKCHVAGGLELQERWRFSTCFAVWRPPKVVTTLRGGQIATGGNVQLAQLAADKRMHSGKRMIVLGARW